MYNGILNYTIKPGLVFELTMKNDSAYISLPGRKILFITDKLIGYYKFYGLDYYYKRKILQGKERDSVLLLAATKTKDEKIREQLKVLLKM